MGPLPRPEILTFAEAAYPGWKATVDGRVAPILLANDAFQAVELSPGPHLVRFEYSCHALTTGLIVAAVAAALAAAIIAIATWRIARSTSPRFV
ncbi:MAG: YfhO family protein [Candidatus Hydrogenedentes bacterium]|nr:YfhO family protein [Candidatus Hydrogenedentota bacterium]